MPFRPWRLLCHWLTLLEVFHESGEISDPVPIPVQDLFFPIAVFRRSRALEFFADASRRVGIVKEADPAQDGLGVEGLDGFPVRFLDEEMEVVAHHAVGDHAHPVEGLQFAHQGYEMFFFFGVKDEPSVHHPRDAVVVAFAFSPDAGLSHGGIVHAEKAVRKNIVQ